MGRGLSPTIMSLTLLTLAAAHVVEAAIPGHTRKILQNGSAGTSAAPPPASSPPNSQVPTSSQAPSSAVPGNTSAACPTITISLSNLDVYVGGVSSSNNILAVQCYKSNGVVFPPVLFPASSYTSRSSMGATYTPSLPVAQLDCGESIACTVGYSSTQLSPTWTLLAQGGCWFDYRLFTTLSYQNPVSAWTCTHPPVQYTLQCVECGDPNFPWATASALSGPPASDSGGTSHTLNTVMVVFAVSIVVLGIMLVTATVIMRRRRQRAAAEARRAAVELAGQGNGPEGRGRNAHKPPDLYVVGDPVSDQRLPEGYQGPIVVLHCGEVEESAEDRVGRTAAAGESTANVVGRYPQIALARPEEILEPSETEPENETA